MLESAVITRLYESLSTIRLVKMFAREEHEVGRFHGVARAAIDERLAVTDQESLFGFLVGSITIGGASLILGVGAVHVLHGTLTVGTLLVVMSYLGFVYGPLSAIATTTGSLHHALASARRVGRYCGCRGKPIRTRGCRWDGCKARCDSTKCRSPTHPTAACCAT